MPLFSMHIIQGEGIEMFGQVPIATTWLKTLLAFFCLMFLICPSKVGAKLLFKDDFESSTIGKAPDKWTHLGPPKGYNGGGLSVVEKDPLDASNKVFHLIPKGFDANSHDLWSVHEGDRSWVNYVWEFDWLFPEDTYCPVAFRVVNQDEFCQLSRRPGFLEFHVYAHTAQQQWNEIKKFGFKNEISKWYRVQVTVNEDSFTFKIKGRDDKTPFAKMKEPDVISEAKIGQLFSFGGIAIQEGYTGMIDNVIVGETEADIIAVELKGKLTCCWGALKEQGFRN